jgi:hypothetical protein
MNTRSYRCEGCGGEVAIPDHSKTITLDQVQAVHDKSCPQPTNKRTRVTAERKMARKAVAA